MESLVKSAQTLPEKPCPNSDDYFKVRSGEGSTRGPVEF